LTVDASTQRESAGSKYYYIEIVSDLALGACFEDIPV